MKSVHVLFVCLGNICRSPAAEGVLLHLAAKTSLKRKLHIMSCGLGSWHIGKPPDLRMKEVAAKRGIILKGKAKLFLENFLDEFDYILCADNEVLNQVLHFTKSGDQKAKVHLMTHYGKLSKEKEIIDPYYGKQSGFEDTLDLLEDACLGLIKEINL